VRLFERNSSIRTPVYFDRAEEANAEIAHSFGRSAVPAWLMSHGQRAKANACLARVVVERPQRDRREQVRAGPALIRRSRIQFLAPGRLANRSAFVVIATSHKAQEAGFPLPQEFAP
jgi:hypothetical protein